MENKKRDELIEIVENKGYTIKKAAQLFKINYSTAKHIIKQHRLVNQGNEIAKNEKMREALQNLQFASQVQGMGQNVANIVQEGFNIPRTMLSG